MKIKINKLGIPDINQQTIQKMEKTNQQQGLMKPIWSGIAITTLVVTMSLTPSGDAASTWFDPTHTSDSVADVYNGLKDVREHVDKIPRVDAVVRQLVDITSGLPLTLGDVQYNMHNIDEK